MQTVTILGATGSIGVNTIDVINRHPDKFRVFALTGHRQIDKLIALAEVTNPRYVVVSDEDAFAKAKQVLSKSNCKAELLVGNEALNDVCRAAEVDTVMSAIVGAAGLLPTMAAVKAGKTVLLANKESLVMSGEIFIDAVNEFGASLLPIDSEHNAIFQCLPRDYQYGKVAEHGISKILLTGSGGPFIGLNAEELSEVTPEQACAHPNWDMGQKISVDSASMMNKGLEFIEAKWLFGLKEKDIEVVLHPQSTIHSMVQYLDGSVIAQMGNPDMRTPIAYGLSYPKRISSGVEPLDFSTLKDFTFSQPTKEKYPNLYLCIEACKQGQSATTRLNAANEVAVDAFLRKEITFTDIAKVNQTVLETIPCSKMTSIQQILEHDALARASANTVIRALS
ncbi:1-deoxy-D-xylulose-5-phosphate reductoisomerase [Glaciecola sp. KUL10]|uniref:1-deoxy-D-xylulose-5-phosphate reductoisomerase n=1 Tax=Glaciecola sp. (strain KUL10) TaxID=2161813 RepID=UPI000D787E9B|nr:1-deoxy-D-xylulose-5-phosphate reductoisomerase [Glaciecola sp. KUL10]